MLYIIAILLVLFLINVYRCEKIVVKQKELNNGLEEINKELINIEKRMQALIKKMEE